MLAGVYLRPEAAPSLLPHPPGPGSSRNGTSCIGGDSGGGRQKECRPYTDREC